MNSRCLNSRQLCWNHILTNYILVPTSDIVEQRCVWRFVANKYLYSTNITYKLANAASITPCCECIFRQYQHNVSVGNTGDKTSVQYLHYISVCNALYITLLSLLYTAPTWHTGWQCCVYESSFPSFKIIEKNTSKIQDHRCVLRNATVARISYEFTIVKV